MAYRLGYLDALEAESIHILRETAAGFAQPAMLYSMGKDSSVLLHLAQKAFFPGEAPFPLVHVDTTFKFPEMIAWRERIGAQWPAGLSSFVHPEGVAQGVNPVDNGLARCCAVWKTRGLLGALAAGGIDAAIGGARREEERSRAKERVLSVRDSHGQWDPRRQRPELWQLLNTQLAPGETMRVFPLSNWTELDVWRYIAREEIEVLPLYFAAVRRVVRRGDLLFTTTPDDPAGEDLSCRYRTLGCMPCTGAVPSTAATVEDLIAELEAGDTSERATRAIDYDRDGAMELKKREGYF
ncbi:sulfate adenylyltransferase subunit 2 [Planctomycetota bacterium]|nr:sulfate adenylyltransferase subunit 2 [Planctomycetota bacterium]